MLAVLVAWVILRGALTLLGLAPSGAAARTGASFVLLAACVVAVHVARPRLPGAVDLLRMPWRVATGWLAGGLVAGVTAMSAVFAVLLVGGWFEFDRVDAVLPALLMHASVWVLVALHEELLFRGVLLRGVEPLLGSIGAVVLTACAFAAAHVDGGAVQWRDSLLLAVGGGLLFGACAVVTRSLWTAVGVHAGWNLAQSAIFGLPAQAYGLEPVVSIGTVTGPSRIAGTTASVESGVVAAVVAALLAVALLWWGRGSLRSRTSFKRSRRERDVVTEA